MKRRYTKLISLVDISDYLKKKFTSEKSKIILDKISAYSLYRVDYNIKDLYVPASVVSIYIPAIAHKDFLNTVPSFTVQTVKIQEVI
jgi:hypothetical protein